MGSEKLPVNCEVFAMQYIFELVGISPVLSFFNQQQELQEKQADSGVEYLANHQCHLDTFVSSVEMISNYRSWDLDQVVDTVIKFWVNNEDSINYWKERLRDAGKDNLLIARVADIGSLKNTFENLFRD